MAMTDDRGIFIMSKPISTKISVVEDLIKSQDIAELLAKSTLTGFAKRRSGRQINEITNFSIK